MGFQFQQIIILYIFCKKIRLENTFLILTFLIIGCKKDEVHDVTINIISDYSTEPTSLEIIFYHIHNTVFNIDTSFIADIQSRSMANYNIQISAEDISGNSN